jgi:hypothetical protein
MNILDLLAKDDGEGLVINPQLRQKCPVCIGKHSLSIPNEEFAKCFRCGKFWSITDIDRETFWVNAVLAKLANLCYIALNDKEQGLPAREYLRKRGIEDDVVHAGPIGVVPCQLDVTLLRSFLKTTYEAAEIVPPDKPAGRTKDDIFKWLELKQQAEHQKELYESLKSGFNSLVPCAGWLALFYSDEQGLCSVKLRNMKTVDFKRVGSGGVFWPEKEELGYSETWLEVMEQCDEEVRPNFIAFEGEFNLLQWHSALWRVDKSLGRGWVPNPSCALGGSNTWDTQVLLSFSKDPVINADNDIPGIEAVRLAVKRGKTPLRYFTLDGAKDMDEYLRDQPAAIVIDKLLDAFPRIDWMCREFDDVREEINEVLGVRTNRLNTQIAVKIIWHDLFSRGKFYWTRVTVEDVRTYFWYRSTKILVHVERDHKSIWWRTHLAQYGVMSKESFAKQMVATIIERSVVEGVNTQIHSLAHYNKETNTCYVNLGASKIAVITADTLEVEWNGFDGVLFLNDVMDPVQLLDITKPDKVLEGNSPVTQMLARSNISPSGVISVKGYRHILIGRLMSHFFKELVTEKPIIDIVGPYKSGKTEVVRQIGLSLFGKEYKPVVTNQEDRRNMEALLTSKEFVQLDNLDEDVKPEILNILAVAVTGGALSQRRLYSDGENMEIELKANLWVTSQTIPWNRGDVLGRTIQIPVVKLPPEKVVSPETLMATALQERNAVFTDILYRIQNALRYTPELGNYPTDFRVQGLSNFIVTMSEESTRNEVIGWFNALAGEDKVQLRSESRIFERIQQIIAKYASKIRQSQKEGHPWEMGLADLIDLMDEGVTAHSLKIKSPQAVARFIEQEAEMFKEIGFTREKNRHKNSYQFVFNPSEEVIASCISFARKLDRYSSDETLIPDTEEL